MARATWAGGAAERGTSRRAGTDREPWLPLNDRELELEHE